MLKRVFAVVVVTMSLTGAAVAGPFEDGVGAYERGDYVDAVKWYRLAADQGNADAQYSLGLMYSKGQGVPQDDAESVKQHGAVVDLGVADALFELGEMYDAGHGISQNYDEAAKWYRLAADQGHARAQYHIGNMYSEGEGVPKDYVQAYMWLSLAAAQGLADAVDRRDLVASQMTPDQVAEAQRQVLKWRPSPM